ncbi:MAG TPA: N-acetyltransferase [Acidimicrobiia bacterium]|nr:N-acetyltransferase [Acidimicrobiia bacterium]
MTVPHEFIPVGWDPPRSFDGPGFRLEPLGPAHNERDHEAWSSSMDHIRDTPGEWGDWPRPMTLADNLADLEGHAREFADREAFTYSVLDGDEVIGCLYIYPDDEGPTDAYVSSWVTERRAEMDTVVWRAVSKWLDEEWPFRDFRYAVRQ